MKIDVHNLAKLARIGVSGAEAKKLEGDLESILGYVSELEAVDVKAEESGALPEGALRNVLREDADPYPSGAFTEAILAEAPKTEEGYLVVKQILGSK